MVRHRLPELVESYRWRNERSEDAQRYKTLASLVYARDNDGHVKTITSKDLPGEEKSTYEYDANSRLTKGAGINYEDDSANNPTEIGTGT